MSPAGLETCGREAIPSLFSDNPFAGIASTGAESCEPGVPAGKAVPSIPSDGSSAVTLGAGNESGRSEAWSGKAASSLPS